MARKRKRKLRKITIFLFLLSIFIFSFLLDRKKVVLISSSSFSNDSDYRYFLKEYDTYPEELLDMFSRNPDMAEYMLGYPTKKGKVFGDTVGDIKDDEVPLLLQYDERWGYGNYGETVLAVTGCGPTSLSMVITYLTGDNTITPYVVAKYSESHGYYDSGHGSRWSLMTTGSSHFGIVGKEIPLSKQTIYQSLEEGHPIICSMRPGDFTQTGHFIVLAGIEDGKIKVNDPNSRERSQKLWDYDTLYPQIKGLWTFEKA